MKPFTVFLISLLVSIVKTMAQAPTYLPKRNPEPLGFFDSTENIVFFVILPIIITILYFIWKRNTSRLKNEEEQKE
jgi:heme/copper-type cytochrome/quinol oxidase subunit 2